NIAVLSPIIFTTDQIGLTQVMIAMAVIIAQLGNLGFNTVTARLFPLFRAPRKGHNGYLSLAFLVTGTGFVICLIGLSLYMPAFVENNREKSMLLSQYAGYLPVLVGIIMLFTLLDYYSKVLFHAVLGTFLREFVMRLVLLGSILSFYFGFIDFSDYVFLFIVAQAIPVLGITIYLLIKGEFKFTGFREFITPSLRKQMLSLCAFGIISGLSGIAITSIDKYMVNAYVGLSGAGIYSIAVYFASLILIPARSLQKIAIPVISEAWKTKDYELIQNVYYKSSINQLIIGLLIYIGIIANLNNIFRLLPPEYAEGKMVIIFFGLANLIRVSAGVCMTVLTTSSRYRYMTYLMISQIVLVISSNIVLIPTIGIGGAAVAFFITTLIYISMNILLLKRFFGFWPFRKKHLVIIVLSLMICVAGYMLPEMVLVTDIIIRSLFIIILFAASLLLFNISEDVNNLYSDLLKYLKKQ
ncbi:MAG: polysaccharide biosynthesis C-terminal domain-containing protein, partial [bacterium]